MRGGTVVYRGAWRAAIAGTAAARAALPVPKVVPTFLVLGAQRAGTTSLMRHLTAHPDVYGPVRAKGVHYFDSPRRYGLRWYASHFPHERRVRRGGGAGGPGVAVGEASPYYLFHPLAAERIRAALGAVRLVVLLRDPATRAQSHHAHEVSRGFETLPFEAALAAEDERLAGEEARLAADPRAMSFAHQHHSYFARGLYERQLRRYLACFDPSQLLVLESEAFYRDPGATVARVFEFIGVDPTHPTRPVAPLNAERYAPVDPGTAAMLAERYREPNAALARLLGWVPTWAQDPVRP